MAATETLTYQDSLNSQYLSSSIRSLSDSRSTNSLIVRTYKQATQLYLTKRFKEALEVLEPIISTQQSAGNDNEIENVALGPAPIVQSSKGTRTKVWVFYLSLLDAIADLGQEDGRMIFGSSKWRQLANKAREGTVWEEVVQCGYGGHEGDVDADVVVNLVTLLLGHMQDQRLTQQRLEAYLAASDGKDSNGHFSFIPDGMSTPMSQSSSSPKLLVSRLKILELYALHVLPSNDEWQYAATFIEMNDLLDEERKEAFVNALQQLREEKDGTVQRERDLNDQREKEIQEETRKVEEARLREQIRKEDEERRKANEAENARTPRPKPTNGAATAPSSTSSHKSTPTGSAARPSNKAAKKPQRRAPSSTFFHRASVLLTNLPQVVLQAGRSLNLNSMVLLRMLIFMVAFLLIVARRDLRVKMQQMIDKGWVKIKRTVGMGVKVSYV